ncbi:MAG TPA: hypothetical protein GXZ56_00870 [Bacteroidales bacterium]|jgi:hypothetical protein|nr:hypothetical protein [Bacteroidales bacterium]
MKTKPLLTGLIIAFSAFCSCDMQKEIEGDIFSISFSKSNSLFDYFYEATIDQNGLMQVTDINGLTETNRQSEYILDDSDIKMIKEKLNSLVKVDISDKYGFDNENSPTDLPVTKLKYKTTVKSDSTSIYYPKENELPVELNAFLQTIKQVILDNDTLLNH